ncbi:UDP-N-acetylmuramoyl-tripeptide--D-alanyl-D-alanine ligase [Winogradskyella sp.]|uniref:UDP-N-acetylmuramoyl-tripeptide--D-alanyl-D- alanine ligase n=1 Tax=Winogradskyella sp. TaxID=1883156 RepID=UPI001B119EB7|nr:UDP-N-acetylmuramoyl-tripeptide--D-alanyl-D-alanine ligase [Winogradskyella sp.]MBO6881671.1 UDP-N-acetylmuramoyl-tripeptide--D-alanyl-D-alanine ligase [Winogradskyella sp.]
MKIESLYQKFKKSSGISTDTRKLSEGCMYFALKGDNFDGNEFVEQAFNGGAKYCVVDNNKAVLNDDCFIVDDVLTTLQNLATYHRNEIDISIISLTGSNGKTTTKELINVVLSTQYNVSATKGNLNNHIGVPLTLLSFSKDLDFGIVEMGANHKKEIEFLSNIAQPDYGLITNFGKAHLEGFGSIEGVIEGKSELYNFLKTNNKTVFVNADDSEQLNQIGKYQNTVKFGSNSNNDCVVEFIEANPFVTIKYDGIEINSQLIGDYNFGNIANAVAIGQYFNVTRDNIKSAIENYQPDNNRSEIIQKGSVQIILDAYNANPTSMLAALKNLQQLETENKYLFLGDMFELGADAEKEHQNIADFAEQNFRDNVYLIGENFSKTTTSESIKKFKKFEDLKPILNKLNLHNSTLLIKGSRGMALERILDIL